MANTANLQQELIEAEKQLNALIISPDADHQEIQRLTKQFLELKKRLINQDPQPTPSSDLMAITPEQNEKPQAQLEDRILSVLALQKSIKRPPNDFIQDRLFPKVCLAVGAIIALIAVCSNPFTAIPVAAAFFAGITCIAVGGAAGFGLGKLIAWGRAQFYKHTHSQSQAPKHNRIEHITKNSELLSSNSREMKSIGGIHADHSAPIAIPAASNTEEPLSLLTQPTHQDTMHPFRSP